MSKLEDKNWRWSNSGKQMVLEGYEGRFILPFKIKSSNRYKKEMKKTIREEIKDYFKNKKFDQHKKTDLDLAIHLEVSDKDHSDQDLDNVQKIVLDALQKDKDKDPNKDPSWNYLYEKDARICRILVLKSKKEVYPDDPGIDTVSATISFRIHKPTKQMKMKPWQGKILSKYGFMAT